MQQKVSLTNGIPRNTLNSNLTTVVSGKLAEGDAAAGLDKELDLIRLRIEERNLVLENKKQEAEVLRQEAEMRRQEAGLGVKKLNIVLAYFPLLPRKQDVEATKQRVELEEILRCWQGSQRQENWRRLVSGRYA